MPVRKINPGTAMSIARNKARPNVRDYIQSIVTDFIELKGDRLYADDASIFGGIGYIDNYPVTILGTVKGKKTIENITANFGMPHPEGYRKAQRLFKQAEKFSRPIICLIDTPGAYCGVGAEERGQGRAIADNLLQMMGLKTPVLSIIIGEGGSGGALALAVANEVYMQENAIYSVISPEGCASILYKDASKVKEAAKELNITSDKLLELGVIEDIIDEPLGGAHCNAQRAAMLVKDKIVKFLEKYQDFDKQEIVEQRYDKFRKIGIYKEN